MAYPLGTPSSGANPNPAYSGTFIPEIWSAKLVAKFYDATVLAAICNTDYEGEIKNQGDKVKIRTKPTITIRKYKANSDIVLERPSSNVLELLIDQGEYFATILDDVMEVQADINLMSMWSDDASEQMKITIDTNVLNYMVGGASANNIGATAGKRSHAYNLGADAAPLTLTRDNIVDSIVDAGTVLDESNIPETGRWIIMPPWACNLVKKSELRDASLSGDGTSILRNGRLGMIDRFTLYSSNLLPTSTTDWTFDASGNPVLDGNGDPTLKATNDADAATYLHFGHSHATTFALQLSRLETLRAERTFGNIMRGLSVYGRRVIDPTALGRIYAKKG